jgi:catechol-2,3-dioxygenase
VVSLEPTSALADHIAPNSGLNAFRPRIAFVTCHVQDVERALAFYVGVLGMQEQTRFPSAGA